jgi:hypothetical protein
MLSRLQMGGEKSLRKQFFIAANPIEISKVGAEAAYAGFPEQ